MSAVTLSLRVSSANVQKLSNKSTKLKAAEILPPLPQDLKSVCDVEKFESIVNAQSLEAQIIGIREVSITTKV